ncbi:DUF5666 domain-containing protein [Streptacidiphilus sp. EB129]|uniref:DUF5666 domain-containing protein n=1 Tax=Streptacidiphilus sp. EB129 TaxID=3156262 RepID=UPI003512954C
MRTLPLRRRGIAVASLVLAGGVAVGGATAYAASGTTATPSASPSATAAHQAAHRHLRTPRGIHGQATVKNGVTGQYVTREWQRGQVTSVSGATLTVKSADGTSWTWTTDSSTKVTRDGKKINESVLANGDTVEVLGKQSGTANDATRIFAPSAAQIAKMKAKSAATPTPSPTNS